MTNLISTILVLIFTVFVTGHEAYSPLKLEVMISGSPARIYFHSGRCYIEAIDGAEYSIRLTNQTSRRMAVALAVDGLNTIDAKHSDAHHASKWVLGPWETIVIDGWQVSAERCRRFYFTTEDQSYGATLGQTANLGLISAVVFYEKQRPIVERKYMPTATAPAESQAKPGAPSGAAASNSEKSAEPMRAEASGKDKSQVSEMGKGIDDYAATGMGRSQDHQVERVYLNLEDYPAQNINIRYEYRPALVRLGVLPEHPDRLWEREKAHGFSGGEYCPEVKR